MGTQVDIFSAGLPTYAINSKSQAMQAMGSGIAGGGFGNRISLRNSKFRFLQNGEIVGTHADATLPVVIFALANNVQRLYYEGAFDPNVKTPPTCFSMDGKVPSPESPKLQASHCATCPQNVKGSGRQGNTKACAYKKRVVVLSPDDIEGPAYSLDVNGQSMFGEQIESKNLFSFKGYYEKLVAHNMDIAAIITQLSFDDAASVPKLHFSPVRVLTAEEFAVVQKRAADEDVAKMLKDMTNEAELDEILPTPAPAPKIAAPTPPPAPAPEVNKGVGGLVSTPPRKGFGGNGTTTAAAPPATPKAPAGVAPVTINLDKLVTFDD